ncbi:YL1 nuclear protein-domain-containing protein [Nemania sp. FL0916]|nr:YL1 nuclear protein-domain-containing protein [Nemania sp. FL0916]
MANLDEEERMRVDGDENDASSSESSDSDNDLSGHEDATKIEWLATGREKRSTAGNRMKSMLAAEEPDDELELLFAEDADDAGFTEVEDDGSDAQMSSSEDEDAQENADELEGEKELEKQARESRQAARKRKAQEAIPIKFRKKVKIDTSQTPSASATPAPKPRPKKKSERISWLPSPADMPTRASKRETTMAGKEQLHKQMAEREVKRLQQIEAMERKAKKMEALKKPPMTQAERLAEAALVEKRNAKSLNRWEEAEKQREEERKAKLAALNNRTLEGPVVTFWSGVGEWIDGKLKHVGKIVTIEEKPAKKKRQSVIGPETTVETSAEHKSGQLEPHGSEKTNIAGSGSATLKKSKVNSEKDELSTAPNDENLTEMDRGREMQPAHGPTGSPAAPTIQDREASTAPTDDQQPPVNASQPQISSPTDVRSADLKPPDLQTAGSNLYTASVFAPPIQALAMPPEMKAPSNSFLAPPMGISENGLSVPMIGYHPSLSSESGSNILAPPNPAQRQSPLSMPRANIQPPPALTPTPTRPTQATPTQNPRASPAPVATSALPHTRPLSKISSNAQKLTKVNTQKHEAKEAVPSPLSPYAADGKATRNCIILQNFNENAIKDKTVQTRILFNREMNKLPRQGPATRCVITNHPARYRDPTTGLPYYNAYAFKQIQKLYSGEYKWSDLIGAWMGSGGSSAVGVPARFMDPDAPGPPKEQAPPKVDDKVENSDQATELQATDRKTAQASVTSIPQSSSVAAPIAASQTGNTGQDEATPASVPSGQNSSAQPYAQTTGATFALHPNQISPLDTPVASNAQSQTIGGISSNGPTDVMSTHQKLSTVPAVPADIPITSSSSSMAAPATAVKQEQ